MAKCKYSGCNEEAFMDNYCILHLKLPEHEKEDSFNWINGFKEEKVQSKLNNGDFNFEGAILDEVDFKKITFDSDLNFKKAKIERNVKLEEINVSGNLDFSQVIIGGNLRLDGLAATNVKLQNMEVKGKVQLCSIESSELNLKRANIKKCKLSNCEKVNFFNLKEVRIERNLEISTEIKGNIDIEMGHIGCFNFWGDTIHGFADFTLLEVKSFADFYEPEFKGGVHFWGAQFGSLSLKKAKFFELIDFLGLHVEGFCYFQEAKFFNDVDFRQSHFKRNVYFNDAVFKSNVQFNEVEFGGEANFANANFGGYANFETLSFLSKGIFEKSNLNASFEAARLKNVSFINCNLTNVKFKNAILENCELSTSEWKDNIPEHKHYIDKKTKNQNLINLSPKLSRLSKTLGILWTSEFIPDAKIAADTYRRIRQSLQQQGAYDKAGKFYVEEMDLKKEIYWDENKGLWLVYNILAYTTGYGEKLANILIIFVGYWILYVLAVYSMPDNKLVIPVGSGILSIVTALFVYVFARKMSR